MAQSRLLSFRVTDQLYRRMIRVRPHIIAAMDVPADPEETSMSDMFRRLLTKGVLAYEAEAATTPQKP